MDSEQPFSIVSLLAKKKKKYEGFQLKQSLPLISSLMTEPMKKGDKTKQS